MNRLTPLIERRTRIYANFASLAPEVPSVAQQTSGSSDDVRMFLMSLVGGFVFFSTLIA